MLLAPLRAFHRWRLDRYYDRTRDDRTLAERWAAHYLAGLVLPPHARVLDHGCGRGRVTAQLTQLGYHVTGTDTQPHPWWSTVRAQWVVEQGTRLPFADQHFDLALDVGVIGHFSESALRELASEMRRVLKPGATWMVLEANSDSYGAAGPRRWYGRLHTLATMRAIAATAGFREIDVWYEGVYLPVLPRVVNILRKQLWPGPMTIEDYGTWLERRIPTERRALWCLRLAGTARTAQGVTAPFSDAAGIPMFDP